MKNVFEIVIIDSNYCSFLRKYDNRVCYNAGSKKLRPFIGVLFKVKNRCCNFLLLEEKCKIYDIKNEAIKK